MELPTLQFATTADRTEVWALWRACMADEHCLWDERYPDEQTLESDLAAKALFVLRGQDCLIGSVTLFSSDELLSFNLPFQVRGGSRMLTRLCVHPTLWHRGHGAHLLKLAENHAAEAGTKAIHLLCDVRNLPGLALFDHNEYREVFRRELFGDLFSVREKKLQPSQTL